MAEDDIREPDFDYIALQHSHGGKWVVHRGNEVIVSADSHDELCQKFETMPIDWDSVVTQYIQRPDEIVIHGLPFIVQGDFARTALQSSAPGDDTNRDRDA